MGAALPGGLVVTNRISSNQAWATLLLKDVGAKPTPNNVANVMRWMAAENPPNKWDTRNNPLNASLNTSAKDGTGSYSDLTTSATNTANMIVQGYKGGAIGDTIYNALMNDAPPDQFSVAVVDSAWSSNHYGVGSAGANAPAPGRLATYMNTIPIPAIIPANSAYTGSGAVQPADVSAVSPSGVGCSGKPPIMKFNGVLGVGKWQISACNGKAIIGGFTVVAGAVILLAGAFLLAKDTAMSAATGGFMKGVTSKPVAE